MDGHYDNKRELKPYRRRLRKDQTLAEVMLWKRLRRRQLSGWRFQRQYSVDWFILDFYCHERKLAIEADGGHHAKPSQKARDQARTEVLNSYGIRVIRFWNHEILESMDLVLAQILNALESPPSDPTN